LWFGIWAALSAEVIVTLSIAPCEGLGVSELWLQNAEGAETVLGASETS